MNFFSTIYHLPVNLRPFDAMILASLSIAAYIHLQFVWLLYIMCYLVALALFLIIRDVSVAQAKANYDGLEFIARCIRDKE